MLRRRNERSLSRRALALAGVVDSAIAAINAVIETLQQKEQQLADVRSRLAAAEAQARLVVAAPPNLALLQSEVEALRTENRRLAELHPIVAAGAWEGDELVGARDCYVDVDLRDRRVISVVFNPGWVQTDMGGRSAPVPVDQSVHALVALIDGLVASDSGDFLDWRGKRYEW